MVQTVIKKKKKKKAVKNIFRNQRKKSRQNNLQAPLSCGNFPWTSCGTFSKQHMGFILVTLILT